MKLAILKERRAGETRVAATPESVKKLKGLGLDVRSKPARVLRHAWPTAIMRRRAPRLQPDAGTALADADIILCVRAPDAYEVDRETEKRCRPCGAARAVYGEGDDREAGRPAGQRIRYGVHSPHQPRAGDGRAVAARPIWPATRPVIDAAAEFGRAMPMMMTAAGTIAPARVLIMGVGVAGLQAIATARRLGAIASATDVRPATKEQVELLGATFVAVIDEEFKQAETAGGYAKEMSKEYQAKQTALIAETIKKQDIVITTALIPGRRLRA